MKVGAIFVLSFALIVLAKNLDGGLYLIIYILLQGLDDCLIGVEVWKKSNLTNVRLP